MENPALKRRGLCVVRKISLCATGRSVIPTKINPRFLGAGFFVMVVPGKVRRFAVTTRNSWGVCRTMHTVAPVLRNACGTLRGIAQDMFPPSSNQPAPAHFRSAADALGHQC